MDRSHNTPSFSPLSNTGAFAGVIVGVIVSCLIIIGFLIYKIKRPKPELDPHTLSQNSAHFPAFVSSKTATTGPIKLPPQHAQHASPDLPPDHTTSNPFSSLRRSSQRSRSLILNPAVANSNDSPRSRSGPFLTPPGTPNDRNGLELSLSLSLSQRSERASLSHPNPRPPFGILSSGSSGIGSYRGQDARASTGAGSAATSQAVSVPRPLPVPPHSLSRSYSPSPYSLQQSSGSGQNHSSVPSPPSSAFPSDEKPHSHAMSDEISRVGQSQQPSYGESAGPSAADNLGAEGLQSPFRDPNMVFASSTLTGPLRDSMLRSSTEMEEHGNVPPSSWRSALSPYLPRSSSVVSDPFNNKGFELPGWLDSDPYSRSRQDAHATTSNCSVAQGSVAASSKMLPSDTSVRTLTPEPSEGAHDATLHVAVLARFRTTSLGHATDAEGAMSGENVEGDVEGDGPESYAVQISDGAQRRGWGTENKKQSPRHEARLPSSRPRLLHLRSSRIVHPSSLSSPTSPPTGIPLSTEFEARGLGRSFIQSLIHKVLRSPTTSRDNSRLLTPSQEPTRSPEGLPAWLRGDPFEMPRASIGAASSRLLPSEVGHEDASSRPLPSEAGHEDASSKLLPREVAHGDASSIRSASVEVGWIEPHPESANVQGPLRPIPETVDGNGAIDAPPRTVINQERRSSVAPDAQGLSRPQSQPRALSPISVPPPS